MSTSKLPEHASTEDQAGTRPLLVILIALCAIFVFTYALRLDERDRMEEAIVAQQEANEVAAARQAALQKEAETANSPANTDRLIRLLLLMGVEGESRMVALNVDGAFDALHPAAIPPDPVLSQPVWQQWLDVFFLHEN